MNKKNGIIFFVGLLFILGLLFVQKFLLTTRYTLTTITIGSLTLHVEIAKTPDAMTKGLGDRNSIGSDGMLFILPSRQVPYFWMKDMRFGLDFVWIDDGKVAALTPDAPAEPGVSDAQLKIYSPKTAMTQVLEINEGDIAKWGIKMGDQVNIQ
ncbi:hypothetical protein C5B42_04235 [Candidatus Cerribacteria bacterium 'Amazon FNV 2010 28 9']|uniref:DUF192 domain-containing protein n=1 Tax=Candidatus Cerribacteria bacterium 'Amazon FNV 2010 28 9' TaxID=2081795 RepID=A0A317JMY2_9BACT|nr:MAG: hypothetical protein C5B42_04235 [Candidatus Cerribacteria bacterium 'Amazon FNV 2010 28 9']